MKPEISVDIISLSLAGTLEAQFPDSTVYDNPNQQGTELPAWFIIFMPGTSINKEIGNRYKRTLNVDLVYLEDFNLADLYDRYRRAAERLDEILDKLSSPDGAEQWLIHTFDRKWRIDPSALHYEFRLEIRVSVGKQPDPKMRRIEKLNVNIK